MKRTRLTSIFEIQSKEEHEEEEPSKIVLPPIKSMDVSTGNTGKKIQDDFQRVEEKYVLRNKWEPDEDYRLFYGVHYMGVKDEGAWDKISKESVKTKTGYECFERWVEFRRLRKYNDLFKKNGLLKKEQNTYCSICNKHIKHGLEDTEATGADPHRQVLCCILDCNLPVDNRLKYSLKGTYKFKEDFLEKNHHKICNRHYFSDLYKHKKKKINNESTE